MPRMACGRLRSRLALTVGAAGALVFSGSAALSPAVEQDVTGTVAAELSLGVSDEGAAVTDTSTVDSAVVRERRGDDLVTTVFTD